MDSNRTVSRRTVLKGAVAGGSALLLGQSGVDGAPGLGASTSIPPYVLPSVKAGVEITSILTTGERADNGYRMVGIPDGLGAFAHGRTFSLFMNHELTASTGSSGPGLVRSHGSSGAFVSRWTIDRRTLQVLHGRDLTRSPSHVQVWHADQNRYLSETTAWDRLCSADLPDPKALRYGNRGTWERIFFDGEEITFGRAWARIATGPHEGEAWELPRLGKMSFENVVACPHGKEKTIVALFDDGSLNTSAPAASNPSEVFIYIGTKQVHGNEIEQAGFTNGKLYGVRVRRRGTVISEESNEFGLGNAGIGYVGRARFELAELGPAGNVETLTGLQLEEDAIEKDVFRLQRPEDGAWDPRGHSSGTLYFVTTAEVNPVMNSRLWRLRFDDIDYPERGGTIEIVLTNVPGRMFDNITIDRLGRILIQEDTGNNPWVAKIWAYTIETGSLIEVAHHDPELFEPPGGARFITQDEESSGIIDAADILGPGWFLFDVQNHKHDDLDAELVQGGQLLAMYVDPRIGR